MPSDVFKYAAPSFTLWFKFTIRNTTSEDIWIKIGDSNIWQAEVYVPNKAGKYQFTTKLGVSNPTQNKRFSSNYQCALITHHNDSTAKTCYLKVSGKLIKVYAFQVGTTYALSQDLNTYHYAFAGFVGLVLAVFAYNFFLWFSSRDKIYGYYLLYLLSILVVIPYHNGYPWIYHPYLFKNINLWTPIANFFIALFAVQYLKLRAINSWLFYGIWGLTFILVVLFPVLSFTPSPINLLIEYLQRIFILLFHSSLLFCGIYAWRKGNNSARFYVFGWCSVITSILIILLATSEVLPFNTFTRHSLYLGFGIEIILFSMALSDRLKRLRRENDQVQAKNLALIQEHSESLEVKVKEKTKELQDAYEEIQASNEELRQTQEDLADQKNILEHQNQELSQYKMRIGQSFNAAKLIQKAVLPTRRIMNEYFKDYFIIYTPKDIVSGDFYWAYQNNEKQLILVVADCTGHGVPGAFMTLIGNTLLNKIIKVDQLNDPAQILTRLHTEVQLALRQQETQNDNGMDAIVLVLKHHKDEVRIAFEGAKNDLLYIDQSQQTLKELKGTRKSIGGEQSNDIHFETKHLSLKQSSIVYMGSDGLADQNNFKRKKLGKKQIKQLLLANAHLPMNTQKQTLLQALQAHMKGTEQRDDILWMGIKL